MYTLDIEVKNRSTKVNLLILLPAHTWH